MMEKKKIDSIILIKYGVAHGGEYFVETILDSSDTLSVLEKAVRSQLGKSEDKRPPNKSLEWFTIRIGLSSDNTCVVSHDCGNSGLMIGVLAEILYKETGREIY